MYRTYALLAETRTRYATNSRHSNKGDRIGGIRGGARGMLFSSLVKFLLKFQPPGISPGRAGQRTYMYVITLATCRTGQDLAAGLMQTQYPCPRIPSNTVVLRSPRVIYR